MDCELILEMILEADPAALEDALAGSGDHSEHLADCPDCAAAARAVLGVHATLQEEFATMRPVVPSEVAIRAAGVEAARRKEAGRRGWSRALVPLGAAAAVAGLLAIRSGWIAPGDGMEGSVFRPEVMANAGVPGAEVTAPEGTNVAVFRTPDPEIVVYWFYQGGEGR